MHFMHFVIKIMPQCKNIIFLCLFYFIYFFVFVSDVSPKFSLNKIRIMVMRNQTDNALKCHENNVKMQKISVDFKIDLNISIGQLALFYFYFRCFSYIFFKEINILCNKNVISVMRIRKENALNCHENNVTMQNNSIDYRY